MRKFACGSVVPGCDATVEGRNDDEVLAQVAEHARVVHGMEQVPPEVVEKVRAGITGEPE